MLTEALGFWIFPFQYRDIVYRARGTAVGATPPAGGCLGAYWSCGILNTEEIPADGWWTHLCSVCARGTAKSVLRLARRREPVFVRGLRKAGGAENPTEELGREVVLHWPTSIHWLRLCTVIP